MAEQKSNSARGRASREKGKRGEREVAAAFRAAGFPEARRTVQFCGKTGDAADVTGVSSLHIEVKRTERTNIEKWMSQTERDAKVAGRDDIPVVVHRRSHSEWFITMKLEDFFRIYKGANGE